MTTTSRRRRRSGRGPSWGVLLLSLGIAATAMAVPPLILSWSRAADPVAAPATVPADRPVTSVPATSVPATSGLATSGPALSGRPTSPPATTAAFRAIRIDAAAPGNRRSGVAVTSCPICASGSRVQYLGGGHWLIVTVRGVPVAGRRTLTIIYESDGPRDLHVAVNSDPTVTLTLAGAGSWTSPARTSIPIDLPAGTSEIKFFNDRGTAPDLDRILIT